MLAFPHLDSGAVCQYPTLIGTHVAVAVLKFLDGSDQRFRLRAGVHRRWRITLNLLTTPEASMLEQFFVAQSGSSTPFDFPDPVSGTLVSNCRFSDGSFDRQLLGLNVEALSLWVVETNG